MSNEVLSAAYGAIAGVVGAIVLNLTQAIVSLFRSKDKKIQILRCAPDYNRGQPEESRGELMHHHGHRLDKPDELKKLGFENPVWEWSTEKTGIKTLHSPSTVIYGPYSSGLVEPGAYYARFRIIGKEFQNTANDENLPLLELDILRTREAFCRPQNHVEGEQKQVSIRTVFFKELSDEEWHDFDVPFYFPGEDLWEFRVSAIDGTVGRPDNIKRHGKATRIFFDTITIYKKNKFKLPWE